MAPTDLTDVLARVESYLESTGLSSHHATIVPLTGDASDRRYLRVRFPDGRSIVLAVHAGPITFDSLPFANVAALMQAMSIPAPAILGHSDEGGILALEDLGDVTLQAHLGGVDVAERRARYCEAIAVIARLQARGAELASGRYLPYGVAFDVEKLTWELNYFVRHFVEAFRSVKFSVAERHALDELWASVTGELASEPRVVCHRDYHSRNLMLHAGRLYVIDFQDARLGPDTYDLVSLVRDSYVDIGDEERDELIDVFRASIGSPDRTEFRRRFDLMSVQRNLKALGTFGFQATARQNPVYLQYVPRTMRYARDAMSRHERFSTLREIVASHLPEFR